MRTRKRRIIKLWNTESSKEKRAYLKSIPKDKNGEEEKDDLVKEANRIIEENADIALTVENSPPSGTSEIKITNAVSVQRKSVSNKTSTIPNTPCIT